jgi:hypothetical protein
VALSPTEVLANYPRVVAHVIAQSNGYAQPSVAALIVRDAIERRKNYCEWIYSCYDADPLRAVQHAIRNRHRHKSFLDDYVKAKALVDHAIATGEEPHFASWF